MEILDRCTAIVITDDGGNVLLLHRTDGQGWCLPGGKLEHNEPFELGATRELREETGLDTNPDRLVCLGVALSQADVHFGPETRRVWVKPSIYFAPDWWPIDHTYPFSIRLNPSEHDAYMWASLADIGALFTFDELFPPTKAVFTQVVTTKWLADMRA